MGFGLFFAGAIGGFLGGMGLGGGTLLIPILTTFFGVSQTLAQGANLLSFLPMAFVAVLLHFQKKRVVIKGSLSAVLPAVAGAAIGERVMRLLPKTVLKKAFGAFLVALSLYEVFRPIFLKTQEKSNGFLAKTGEKTENLGILHKKKTTQKSDETS